MKHKEGGGGKRKIKVLVHLPEGHSLLQKARGISFAAEVALVSCKPNSRKIFVGEGKWVVWLVGACKCLLCLQINIFQSQH